MKSSAIIVAAIVGLLCYSAEGTSCRRPRPLQKGRYEYENGTDYGMTQLPENYVVRVVCEPDATLVGDEFIFCQSNGKWSDYPYCNAPITCFLPPQSIANGYVRMRGKSASSIAVYRCNPGFELHGERTVVCDETSGKWQGDVPRCLRPPSCLDPAEPSGMLALTLDEKTGIKLGNLYTERTVFNYTCQTGYHPSSDVTIKCLNGAWIPDADVPECNRIPCDPPTLEPIINGTHNIENRTYYVGEMVQYECNEGFLVDGISWQVCQSNGGPNGIWSDSVPRCKVARCPDPGSRHLDDGSISFSPRNGRGSMNSWPVGTVMTLRCSSHLELMGSSERVCQPDGHWNGTLTSCTSEEYDCPALGNPIHGFKVGGSPQYRVHSGVQFRCHHGYEMVGSEERICTLTGEWTGEMPRCMGRDEFDEFTRVTDGLGRTFDDLTIESGFWEGTNDTNSNSGGRRKRTITASTTDGLDVYFAFDASNSVGEQNFEKGKRFAKLLVRRLKVSKSPGGTRVGAVVYSSEARRVFNVGEHNSSQEVVGAIHHNVLWTNMGTNLPAALIKIQELVVEDLDRRQGTSTRNRVLFIITDGMSNVGGAPIRHAKELKTEFAFSVHCIGISQNTDKKALSDIASKPVGEHVFYLSNYKELDHDVDKIVTSNRSYDECGRAGSPEVIATSRIVGGNEAAPKRWPWQVALFDNNDAFRCGGSLIRKNWVLTAAHCFRGDGSLSKDTTTVHLGLTDISKATDRPQGHKYIFSVAELIVHDDYKVTTLDDNNHDPVDSYHNDIALLRLDRDAMLSSFVRTVCLPPSVHKQPKRAKWYLVPDERLAKVIGWGHTKQRKHSDQGPLIVSNPLKEIDVPVTADDTCKIAMRGRGVSVNTTTEVCAGSGAEADSCQGDSGGPMMVLNQNKVAYRQVGIVSYGHGCAQDGTYGVYTRVPFYVDWIEKKIDG